MTAFLEDLNFCAQALPSFSTLLMTFADSHHWLHCQKKWDHKWWMRSTFFDNEDTLVRWVWRHWKSYHKHFIQAIKCVYPDTFCPLCRLQKQFPLGNAKSLFFNITGQPSNSVFWPLIGLNYLSDIISLELKQNATFKRHSDCAWLLHIHLYRKF